MRQLIERKVLVVVFGGSSSDAFVLIIEKINQDVWILLAIFLAGSIAGMFRSFFFVLAGERLVARLRQRV